MPETATPTAIVKSPHVRALGTPVEATIKALGNFHHPISVGIRLAIMAPYKMPITAGVMRSPP